MYLVSPCSGMENKIRSQKDIIAELEAKIEANLGEITKACNYA